jgi:hypothetical protein
MPLKKINGEHPGFRNDAIPGTRLLSNIAVNEGLLYFGMWSFLAWGSVLEELYSYLAKGGIGQFNMFTNYANFNT